MSENSGSAPAYGTPPSRASAGDPAAYAVRAGLRTSGFFLCCGAMGVAVLGAGIAQRRIGVALLGLMFCLPLLVAYGEIRKRRVFLAVGRDGVYLGEVDARPGSQSPAVHIPWDDVAAVVIHRVSVENSDGDVSVRDAIGVRTRAPSPVDVPATDIVVHHRQTFARFGFGFGFDHDRLRAAVAHFAPRDTELIDLPEFRRRHPQDDPPQVRLVAPGT